MTVARSTGVLLGTDETTGVTIANNATTTGSEIDVLGNNTSEGHIRLFLKFTSTVTAGSITVTLYPSRISGQAYSDQAVASGAPAPTNATQKIFLGDFMASRYMTVKVFNNATGANATNVTVGYELFMET